MAPQLLYNYLKRLRLNSKSSFFFPVSCSAELFSNRMSLYPKIIVFSRFYKLNMLLGQFFKSDVSSFFYKQPVGVPYSSYNHKILYSSRFVPYLNFFYPSRIKTDYLIHMSFRKFESYLLKNYSVVSKVLPINITSIFLHDRYSNFLYKNMFSLGFKSARVFSLVMSSILSKDPSGLLFVISWYLKRSKKHFSSLNMFSELLASALKASSRISGIIIQVSGRFNNNAMASSRIYKYGLDFSRTKFSAPVAYGCTSVYTKIGSFGVKIWMI